MGKTLYISDLDGTLLGADSRISPRSVEMLNRAISRGALFSVATARTPATVYKLIEDVNISVPTIVMTGAAMWNPLTNEYSNIKHLSAEAATKLFEEFRRNNLSIFAYKLKDIIEIYHRGSLDEVEQQFVDERIGNPYKRFATSEQAQSDGLPLDPADMVLCYGMRPDKEVLPVYEAIKDDPNLYALCYHDIFGPERAILEIFSSQASKAAAAKTLAKSLGADRIVAFGDNFNDLPLLQVADVAVAVENAIPELKDHADIVIGPNTADSVPRFILEDMARNSQ